MLGYHLESLSTIAPPHLYQNGSAIHQLLVQGNPWSSFWRIISTLVATLLCRLSLVFDIHRHLLSSSEPAVQPMDFHASMDISRKRTTHNCLGSATICMKLATGSIADAVINPPICTVPNDLICRIAAQYEATPKFLTFANRSLPMPSSVSPVRRKSVPYCNSTWPCSSLAVQLARLDDVYDRL